MAQTRPTESITVRAAKDMVMEIDALAKAMDRTRDYVVVQSLELFLEVNSWQIKRIEDGVAAANEGRVVDSDEVFANIAAKHGWGNRDAVGGAGHGNELVKIGS